MYNFAGKEYYPETSNVRNVRQNLSKLSAACNIINTADSASLGSFCPTSGLS